MTINLQQEIDKITNSSRRPTISNEDDMPNTMAVIYELMRCTSIVPLAGRRTIDNTTLEGCQIPMRTTLYFHSWAIHHDEDFWGDSWIFHPERLLDSNGKLYAADHPNRKRLLAFGAGMRMCDGELFALRRLFIFTTYIAQSFNFMPDDPLHMTSCDPRIYTVGLVKYPPSFLIKLLRRNCVVTLFA